MTPKKVTQGWLHSCQLLDKTSLRWVRNHPMLHCLIYGHKTKTASLGHVCFSSIIGIELNYQSGCWTSPLRPAGDNFYKLKLLNRHQLGSHLWASNKIFIRTLRLIAKPLWNLDKGKRSNKYLLSSKRRVLRCLSSLGWDIVPVKFVLLALANIVLPSGEYIR